jgi:DNA polymerase-3 subunit epsilon
VRQLKAAGLKLSEDQEPQGCVIGKVVYYLYDERQAVDRPPATPAQLAALEKARAALTCDDCGLRVRRKSELRGRLCVDCRRERRIQRMIETAKAEATAWAREVLADPAAIILDTETTGLDNDAEVVEIAVIDARGRTLLNTLVRSQGAIPASASAIHGITDDDVAGAPAWPEIHQQVGELLRGAFRIVTYNARFDRRLLDQTRELYDLPPFGVEPERFECAMRTCAEYAGAWSQRHGSFRWQALNGSHRALGDCLAALDVIREMAAAGEGE